MEDTPMIIVQTQAEEKFTEVLELIRKEPGNRRCLWLDLSLTTLSTLTHLQAVVTELCRVFTGNDCQLFVFHEQGLALIGNGLNYDLLEKFRNAVFSNLSCVLHDEMLQLYDLAAQWGRVSIHAERLLEKKRKRLQEHQQKNKERKRQHILNMQVEPEVIKRMNAVRSARRSVEVMLVEDDIFSRKMVRSSLEKLYHVVPAQNGEEALKYYVTTGPNILFLDIELPDVTGHEILRKIISFDPNAFVVMLSGNGDRMNIMKAMEAGAKGFVAKPFTKDKLLQYIQKCAHGAPQTA